MSEKAAVETWSICALAVWDNDTAKRIMANGLVPMTSWRRRFVDFFMAELSLMV